MSRKAYPSEVSDEEWATVAPFLTLMSEDAPQRAHNKTIPLSDQPTIRLSHYRITASSSTNSLSPSSRSKTLPSRAIPSWIRAIGIFEKFSRMVFSPPPSG